MRRHVRTALALLSLVPLAAAGCGGSIDGGGGPTLDSSSELPSSVNTSGGWMSTEGTYLPGVVHAELGWYTTNQETLKAQAVAARTYLARYLHDNGFGARVPLGPTFMAWTSQFGSADVNAVNATKGQTMHYGGQLIYANFDSGADHLDGNCNPPAPSYFGYPYSSWGAMLNAFVAGGGNCSGCWSGYAWTQIFVTDNQGLTGGSVHPTVQASATSQNRGALGQYQDACFGWAGWSYTRILQYFYGADIEIDGTAPACTPQPAFGTPSSCGGIAAGQGLKAGQSEWSCDGRFQFVMQGDGNLVLYSKYGVPMWASGTNGKGGAFAVMQGDGNLVIYTSAGCPVWASNTYGRSGTSLAVQGDGNVVLYQGSTPIWATNTGDLPPSPSGCGTIASGHGLIPGESESSCDGRFRLDMQGDGNLVLYQNGVGALWASNTYRSAGRYGVMQGDGNFVVYPLGYKPAVWATGTYNHPGTWAAVQNDGNFVLYQGSTPIWASNTCCR